MTSVVRPQKRNSARVPGPVFSQLTSMLGNAGKAMPGGEAERDSSLHRAESQLRDCDTWRKRLAEHTHTHNILPKDV